MHPDADLSPRFDIDQDDYYEKMFSYRTCKVCGELWYCDYIVDTTHGKMCRECFDYLTEYGDDKPELI